MSQTHYEYVRNTFSDPGEYIIMLIYNSTINEDPFSLKSIENENCEIETLDRYINDSKLNMQKLNVPEIPLLAAIKQLCHPIFINYLWSKTPKAFRYLNGNTYNNMPDIFNKETNDFNLMNAIKDVMKWTYINVIYKCHNKSIDDLSVEYGLIFLDKYAEIFGIEYEKNDYD